MPGVSAIATLLHLVNKSEQGDRPKRFVFINRSQGRLDHARQMVQRLQTDIESEFIQQCGPGGQ